MSYIYWVDIENDDYHIADLIIQLIKLPETEKCNYVSADTFIWETNIDVKRKLDNMKKEGKITNWDQDTISQLDGEN